MGQFLTLKNMVTKFFQISNFSDFLGIKSEISHCIFQSSYLRKIKKMESDSDYEEPSEDPFEGQFSDSDDSDASDDSSEENEIDNRDCLAKTF